MVVFKQKTAYEMRISDWSSDLCSSDLGWPSQRDDRESAQSLRRRIRLRVYGSAGRRPRRGAKSAQELCLPRRLSQAHHSCRGDGKNNRTSPGHDCERAGSKDRTEEQTYELQSLMRISYAVICLKKKKKHTKQAK